ncbi:MAG: hypothetical protein JW896_12125 [Deltaproteobacteria bacterium]|nr:hypothetical protein [Deltaproteobacteria bacterium]
MKKKMAIISSYFKDESYGVLGPQMAATVISEHTGYDCIVIAVTRIDDKSLIKKALKEYFKEQTPIIGFSTLSGREDLFAFAGELKSEGALIILAGPQSDVDYMGEIGWPDHPHRFRGVSEHFTFAIHGPAEQALPLLKGLDSGEWKEAPGLLYKKEDGEIIQNPKAPWNEAHLKRVKWNNIFTVVQGELIPLEISIAQVLQQVGCPYASEKRKMEIDYPASLQGKERGTIEVSGKGCSFCDVAVDKGFCGELTIETVMSQISCLPEDRDGRKIPFELINENPLPGLPRLLKEAQKRDIMLSQVHLILRSDWFLKGEDRLLEALHLADNMGIYVLVSSMGFEAFDDSLLRNFNKGVSVESNLRAIRLMRRLKKQFPEQWGYSKREGAIHGFIHPTPWDTTETMACTQKNIAIYGLDRDILPPHSTPLIIHHASTLADWIREVEEREGVHFKREGSVIGWWDEEE